MASILFCYQFFLFGNLRPRAHNTGAMLILTRSIGESIFGDEIVVKMHSVTAHGETVRLAIEASKEIKIQRAEDREAQDEKGNR